VFADVACPFTHVGLRRFVEVRDRLGRPDVRLRLRAWPLEVVNGEPLDPAFVHEEIDALRERVAPELFVGFDEAAFPATSLPALALASAASRRDRATGEAVSLELRDLLFERGRDVADPEVLGTVSERFGVVAAPRDRAEVLADHREGVARGVVGSPYFFTPGGSFFCPTLDISHGADGELRVGFDADGFDRFVLACFGT
jgi:predicted DsbA family dithiol-disulfide isomerase